MTFRSVPTFRDDDGNVVSFKTVTNIPGFSHRVIVNYKPVDYLGNHEKPSAKTAAFFFEKHKEKAA